MENKKSSSKELNNEVLEKVVGGVEPEQGSLPSIIVMEEISKQDAIDQITHTCVLGKTFIGSMCPYCDDNNTTCQTCEFSHFKSNGFYHGVIK